MYSNNNRSLYFLTLKYKKKKETLHFNIFECFMQKRYISYDKDYGFHNIYMMHPLYSASFRELVITLQSSHNIPSHNKNKSILHISSVMDLFFQYISRSFENVMMVNNAVSVISNTSAPCCDKCLIDHYITFDQVLKFMNKLSVLVFTFLKIPFFD